MAYSTTYPERIQTFWKFYRKQSPGSTITFYDEKASIFKVRTRTGTRVPGFKYLIRKGLNAASPYSVDAYRFGGEPEYGRWTGHQFPQNGVISQWYPESKLEGYPSICLNFGNLNHLSIASPKAESLALTRVLKRIRDDQVSFSGGVFLGELRETIGMIKRPARALRDGLSSYMRSVSNKTQRALRGVSGSAERRRVASDVVTGSWLEYSLGWRPLFSDIEGLCELALRVRNDFRISRAGGYALDTADLPIASTDMDAGREFARVFHYKYVTEYSCKYAAGLHNSTTANFAALDRVRELSGLTWSEFIPTIWELVPNSFVADYFLNIGEILAAGTTDTSTVVWVSKTVRQKTTYNVSSQDRGMQLLSTVTDSRVYRPVRSELVRTTLTRTVPTSLGIPALVLTTPFESIGKSANLVALLRAHQTSFNRIVK